MERESLTTDMKKSGMGGSSRKKRIHAKSSAHERKPAATQSTPSL